MDLYSTESWREYKYVKPVEMCERHSDTYASFLSPGGVLKASRVFTYYVVLD